MVGLHLVAQSVDDLLQRLHTGGQLQIPLDEGVHRDSQDLHHSALQHLQLVQGAGRELDLLLIDLLAHVGHIAGVVGDTLKVGDGVEVFGHLLRLIRGQGAGRQLHQIRAQLVLIAVDQLLRSLARDTHNVFFPFAAK